MIWMLPHTHKKAIIVWQKTLFVREGKRYRYVCSMDICHGQPVSEKLLLKQCTFVNVVAGTKARFWLNVTFPQVGYHSGLISQLW
jgi:hypothetical protein